MTTLILLLILIGVVFGLVWFYICRFHNTKIIKSYFNSTGITICGKKGTGKDTLMSYVSYGTEHNCNVPLHPNTNLITLDKLMIPKLTRKALVYKENLGVDFDNYKQFEKPTYISDAGIYFPSWDDGQLKKDYPNLALSIAIWRHLYNAPIHFNTQNYERLWKVLREQIEDTIMTLGCSWVPFYCILKVRYYEHPQDCIERLKPIKHSIFSLRTDTDERIENSHRWEIKDYTLIIPRRYIQHDDRYFKKIVFKGVENGTC